MWIHFCKIPIFAYLGGTIKSRIWASVTREATSVYQNYKFKYQNTSHYPFIHENYYQRKYMKPQYPDS